MDVDVAVVGLGSAGAATLWQLATTTDKTVVGIEQYGVGHTNGSYAGESRVFRVGYHEGRLFVPLLLRSRELWEQVERDSGHEILLKTGTLSVDRPEHEPFADTMRTIREYDLPHRYFDTAELRHHYPQHVVHDGTHAVLDLLGGGLRSELAVLTMVELAAQAGAAVVTNDRVNAIDEAGGRLEIATASGRRIRAAQVVTTTGSWTAELRPELRRLITIVPVGLTWFAPRDAARYLPDRFPVFLRDHDGVHMFGVPSLDGYSVKVVSHNVDEAQRPQRVADLPADLSRAALEEISRNARSLLPDLYPEPVRQSMHHDGYTPTRIPVVDRDPSGRIVTIAGLSGHGFKFATGLGRLAAALIEHRDDPLYEPAFALPAHLDRLASAGV